MPKEPSSVKREKKSEVHTLKSRVGPKWISEKFSYQKRTKAKLQVEKNGTLVRIFSPTDLVRNCRHNNRVGESYLEASSNGRL